MVLLVHKARDYEGFLHTCGNNDNIVGELGAWGVQYHLLNWIAYNGDTCYLTAPDPWPTYYLDPLRWNAENIIETRFCFEPTPDRAAPEPLSECPWIPFAILVEHIGQCNDRLHF